MLSRMCEMLATPCNTVDVNASQNSVSRRCLTEMLYVLLLQHYGSHDPSGKPGTPPLSPKTADVPQTQLSLAQADKQADLPESEAYEQDKQRMQGDKEAEVQDSDVSMHIEHEQKQPPAAVQPENESQQPDLPSDAPSIKKFQQQQDHAESADRQTDRQPQSSDHSLSSALHLQSAHDANLLHNTTPLDSFGSLIETRPDSNGNADTVTTQDAPIQEASIPEVPDPSITATAAEDRKDDARSLSNAGEPMSEVEAEQQAEQRPPSGLYVSSQMDQSSRNSLPESVKSETASQQQPASTASIAGDGDLDEAASRQMTGTAYGGGEPAGDQEASGSQQSSLDNQEQQAELPGTLPSVLMPLCCVPRRTLPVLEPLWLVDKGQCISNRPCTMLPVCLSSLLQVGCTSQAGLTIAS